MKANFKLGLKHWTGTVIVAVLAGFVIFGLLRGQEILNNFLKSEPPTDANFERGELLVLIPSLALTPPPTLKPSPLPKLTPKTSLSPTPTKTTTPTPTPTPTPLPTPTPSPPATPTPAPTPQTTPIPEPQNFSVVINEIAWMGTTADANDEWIELYNPNSQSINITGWTLKSYKIKDGTLLLDTPNITLGTKSIDSFGYFLLERTDNSTVSNIEADHIYTGSLDNGGEILELKNNSGQIQDTVGHLISSSSISAWYNGENNTSTTPATRITMERIDSKKSGIDLTNWQKNNGIAKNGLDKNSNSINGTPRQKNSGQTY